MELLWQEIKSIDVTLDHVRHNFAMGRTYRTKVPGGWLIKVTYTHEVSLTFLPDPDYAWDGSSIEE